MLRSPLRSPLQPALQGPLQARVGGSGARILDFASLTAAQLQSRFGWTRSGAGTLINVSGQVVAGPQDGATFLMRTPDYTHGVPGLLLEGARTNLLPKSQEFADAVWIKRACSIAATATPSRISGLNAVKIVEDTSGAAHVIDIGAYSLSAGVYTLWFVAKAAERSVAYVRLANAAGEGVWFDLLAGTVGTQQSGRTGRIFALGEGWYLCAVTATLAASTWFTQIGPATADNVATYTGNGTSGILLSHAQLELGAYPTSYIPNPGTGTLLRVADFAPITGTEFTDHFAAADVGCTYVLDIRFGGIAAGVFPSALYINNGLTHGMPHTLYVTSDPSNSTYLLGDAVSNATIAVTPFARHKIAFSYKGARRSIAVNGSAVVTDNSSVFNGVASTMMRLSHVAGGTSVAESMTVYSIRVIKGVETTGAALQALTV